MSEQMNKARHFRSLHVPGKPLVLVNCWDVGSAQAIAVAGSPAIATASWAVAAANGYADGEQIPFELVVGNLARIARAVDVPVTVDLETGYGSTPDAVAATIEHAIRAGTVGGNLEDGDLQGGLRPAAEHATRVKSARAAADRLEIPFFINARTDAFLNSKPATHDAAMVGAAVERAHVYAEAGADCLFVPGLNEPGLIEQLVRALPLPVNLMAGDAMPPLSVLCALGVARLSHGPRAYLQMMGKLTEHARAALQA